MIPKFALSALFAAGALLAQTPRDLYLESASAPAHHLGLRYTVLLVDPQAREARTIDPASNLHEGDCVAFEFAANRSGNLYVFNRGSSGTLQILMPSPQMVSEAASVKAGEVKRLPAEHCFRLENPPGVERFVLAITDKPEDARQLRDSLAPPAAGAPANATAVGDLIDSWQKLTTRDLRLEKIDQPKAAGEKPNTVYAVKSSAADSDRLVLEIRIRHE